MKTSRLLDVALCLFMGALWCIIAWASLGIAAAAAHNGNPNTATIAAAFAGLAAFSAIFMPVMMHRSIHQRAA